MNYEQAKQYMREADAQLRAAELLQRDSHAAWERACRQADEAAAECDRAGQRFRKALAHHRAVRAEVEAAFFAAREVAA